MAKKAKDFETNLRRGLQYSNGDALEIFKHPIAIIFIAFAFFSIIRSIIKGIHSMRNAGDSVKNGPQPV